jgi:lambda family phage portal protein
MSWYDRALRSVGLQRVQEPARRQRFSAIQTAYAGAKIDRLSEDWVVALMSPDQEIRVSLRNLRARSRQLAMNNNHALRFLNAAKEQVVGPGGVALELTFSEDDFTGAGKWNRNLEKAWECWSKCCTADSKLNLTAAAQLWLISLLADGESFTHKIKGYPHNDFAFALQFVDPDQVDINWQRLRRPGDPGPNEIRMGVEVDEYRRVVAFWTYRGHPSEFSGIIRERVPASQMDQSFVFKRINQTRGVPWMHAAMSTMNQLGQYDLAEVVASRWAACKMAFLVSKTGDEYAGGKKKNEGPTQINVEPGMMEELPEGIEPKVVDWQHPSHNYESFSLAALRGIAAGLDCSYTTLTGDLRAVNFSSIRQGILTERDGWSVLQGQLVSGFYQPTFESWLPMAILTGQIELPPRMTVQDVLEAVLWTPRGWDWVDPYKDVQASVSAIRSGLSTYQRECAKRGLDWRKVFAQRAAEDAEAKKLNLALDLTTSGAGGIQGEESQEDPQRGAQPTTGKTLPAPTRKPNGQGALPQ